MKARKLTPAAALLCFVALASFKLQAQSTLVTIERFNPTLKR